MKKYLISSCFAFITLFSLLSLKIDNKEIKIGNQIWMSSNLNVSKFSNGEAIPQAKTFEEWERACKYKKPAWCYLGNEASNGEVFGKLYNWYAVNDPRGLAPKGWHIPTKKEWNEMIESLGGDEVAGHKLKAEQEWTEKMDYTSNPPKLYGNGTNESGFQAVPGGGRSCDGKFFNETDGDEGNWWCSSDCSTNEADYMSMSYSGGSVFSLSSGIRKGGGCSVRCVKNSK
jgi:uncharacterized protein (TIGR02145 family)